MPERRIVQGQRVIEGKAIRAKQFRREMTAGERRLWAALRTNRLDGWHFRRQQVIDGLIADFYCHRLGLVVEVDGTAHDERGWYDRERDRILVGHRLYVLRVSNDAVLHNLEAVLDEIRACARELQLRQA